jgi:murein DD-endopeptidase MepM/ murein hydrolase activator NlpD
LTLFFFLASLGNFTPQALHPVGEPPSGENPGSTFFPRRVSLSSETGYLTKGALPFTIIPQRPRREVTIYVVQPGDTVTGIAQKFGLQPETIQWSNAQLYPYPDLLYIGEELFILPLDGVYHKVEAGDTLASIAEEYKVDTSAILESEYNDIADPETLVVGQMLVVPGGSKPYVAQVVYAGSPPPGAAQGSGNFIWPVSGVITQGYWDGHRAVDIGAPCGTSIYASDSGYVAAVGWMEGYGNHILLSHGNGWETLYAHLSQILVRADTSVQRGALIGRVGITGRTTGCHLHFEIRQYGTKRNPFGLLP